MGAGRLFVSFMVPGANLILLNLLKAYGLNREEMAETGISLHEKMQPLNVSSTGKVMSWTDRPSGLSMPRENAGPKQAQRPVPMRGSHAGREVLFSVFP